MSSKVITNPKTSVVPGMNHSLPSGCGFFRGLVMSDHPEHLQYAATYGNRIARRIAKRKLLKLSLQKPKDVNDANDNYVNSEVAAIREDNELKNERNNTNDNV